APDYPKTETDVAAGGEQSEWSVGVRPIVSASALKPGQRTRWRPSPTEAISPRVVKTALRRVIPPSVTQDLYISGRVSTAQGAGIQGVNITVTGGFGPFSSVTDSNGNYTISNPLLSSGYDYTVTPSKAGYTFNPPNRIYSGLNQSVTDADFTGAPVTYAIS